MEFIEKNFGVDNFMFQKDKAYYSRTKIVNHWYAYNRG
jgi:hypothetical protein